MKGYQTLVIHLTQCELTELVVDAIKQRQLLADEYKDGFEIIDPIHAKNNVFELVVGSTAVTQELSPTVTGDQAIEVDGSEIKIIVQKHYIVPGMPQTIRGNPSLLEKPDPDAGYYRFTNIREGIEILHNGCWYPVLFSDEGEPYFVVEANS